MSSRVLPLVLVTSALLNVLLCIITISVSSQSSGAGDIASAVSFALKRENQKLHQELKDLSTVSTKPACNCPPVKDCPVHPEPNVCPEPKSCPATECKCPDEGGTSLASITSSMNRPIPTKEEMMAALPEKCRSFLDNADLVARNCFNAQWCQDWFLYVNWFFWKKGEKGFYVDIGANQPKRFSTTWFYDECLGWDGICVEPGRANADALKASRSCKVFHGCVYSSDKKFRLMNTGFGGGVVARIKEDGEKGGGGEELTNCVTFAHLLEMYKVKHVDFVSLDVEGAEFHSLAGFPEPSQATVDIVVMENNHGADEHSKQVPLFQRGYSMVGHLQGDNVFVRNDPSLIRSNYHFPQATQMYELLQLREFHVKNSTLAKQLLKMPDPKREQTWGSGSYRTRFDKFFGPQQEVAP